MSKASSSYKMLAGVICASVEEAIGREQHLGLGVGVQCNRSDILGVASHLGKKGGSQSTVYSYGCSTCCIYVLAIGTRKRPNGCDSTATR